MPKMAGIDELRNAVKLFNNCNETFNQGYTAEQLIALYRAYSVCGWDIAPDCWDGSQIREVLNHGIVPTFAEDEA